MTKSATVIVAPIPSTSPTPWTPTTWRKWVQGRTGQAYRSIEFHDGQDARHYLFEGQIVAVCGDMFLIWNEVEEKFMRCYLG